ncbi:MAG: hypothetical protein RLN62_04345 [Rickettsiales bacterium]
MEFKLDFSGLQEMGASFVSSAHNYTVAASKQASVKLSERFTDYSVKDIAVAGGEAVCAASIIYGTNWYFGGGFVGLGLNVAEAGVGLNQVAAEGKTWPCHVASEWAVNQIENGVNYAASFVSGKVDDLMENGEL